MTPEGGGASCGDRYWSYVKDHSWQNLLIKLSRVEFFKYSNFSPGKKPAGLAPFKNLSQGSGDLPDSPDETFTCNVPRILFVWGFSCFH